MSKAQLIDGKSLAARQRAAVAEAVTYLGKEHNLRPGLAVILVGDDPASQIYTRNKIKHTSAVGMKSLHKQLPVNTSHHELLSQITTLNDDPTVNGILVQLPLPDHIQPDMVIDHIDPRKDVDGFHPINAGALATGRATLTPCTPQGCILLLKETLGNLEGAEAVVIGRSDIVGKPVAQMLLQENCTVTVTHSRSRNLPDLCRRGDIVIAAVGQPEMIRGTWLKPGATVIDVGINRVKNTSGDSKLVGDVAFDEAIAVAGAITPVPGGVGPMTIACLLSNCVRASCDQRGIPIPDLALTPR